jgi:redox-sensitive bicupin YhaK (pirin superfamily)
MSKSTAMTRERPRQIVDRTRGLRHGAITRLMSPSDLGQILKPFVFLDLFNSEGTSFSDMALHPHSGIATLTYLIEGSVRYEDTSGTSGIFREGGVEWFKAGHGAWHGGGPNGSDRARGFQLWIALAPERELGDVESIYLAAEALQRHGPTVVLLGKYEGVSSRLEPPSSMTYLFVRLKSGETWNYQPPSDHAVAWVALSKGKLDVPEPVGAGELAVFESSNQAIAFYAQADTEFVLGSAATHPYVLALGKYSVHTSQAALRAGERRIAEIRSRLQRREL